MIVDWIEKIKSPIIITAVAVLISEIVFILIGLIFLQNISIFGVIVSFIIPIVAAYPVSSIIMRYHLKIEEQNNELAQLNRIHQRLFSTIAHDIRSPISSVSMLVDLMVTETISMEESTTQLRSVSSNIDILLQFLDELLVWSKQQIDKEPLKPDFFDTELVITQTLRLYENIIQNKNLNVTIRNISSTVFADKGSYSFIVRNVLHNAIKYTPKKGIIELRVLADEYQVITEIKDNGIGINSKTLDNILHKKPYQSENGTNDELGTGFGLKTAIEYLELQGGSLEIDSELNKGTRILINLPFATQNNKEGI